MKILERRLKNGTRCYIIYKKGYVMKQAMFSVNFGAAEKGFVPGLAHFLEHKVFEQRNLNVFDAFSSRCADVNAFTNFNTTAYYFSCCDKFEENLKTLLDFTANPYFTDESVEREKGIIGEEIKMYDDDPWWQVYFNLIKAMYSENPVKNSIAGTIDDLGKINRDMLMDCYHKFYCGENSALVICGDIEPEKAFYLADDLITLKAGKKRMKIAPPADEIDKKLIDVNMEISKALFNIGFRENDFTVSPAHRLCTARILMDLIIGEGGELYGELYSKGILDRDFSMEYLLGSTFGGAIFSGISDNAFAVLDSIMKRINEIKQKGISNDDFERSVKKLRGLFLKGFNSIDGIVAAQTDYAFKDIEFADVYGKYMTVTRDDVLNRLSLFSEDNYAVSLVEP